MHRGLLLLGLLSFGGPLHAQRQPVTGALAIGLSAERRGDFPAAAEQFFTVVTSQPLDGQAILGLSRVLPPLERRAELVPVLARALAIDSSNIGFLALAVRTHALLGHADSAARYVDRWATLVEGEEEPFREWALSALEIHDRTSARRALEAGRKRIANPAALAPELAQFRQAEGDIAGATDEWVRAISNAPVYRGGALLLLGDVSPANRAVVLATLESRDVVEAARLRGLLLMRWGQPEEGVRVVSDAMPEDPGSALTLLRMMFEQIKGRTDPAAQRARAGALELQAQYESGAARVRSWMDAARAWADAGREQDARRLLGQVASDPAAPAGVATAASSALLGVLLAERKPAEAESLLTVLRPMQTMDDRDRDARRVALAWALTGDIARGEALIEPDSSVTGFALRGLLHAFAGDLAGAATWFELAGPYDDAREDAVERVRLLALLHAIGRDSMPEFGAALLTLARSDTVAAVARFDALADTLEPPGSAAVRLFAGELALTLGDTNAAVRYFESADVAGAPGAAPAARFQRARVLAARQQVAAAQQLLEELILDYPDSAVVPAARRFRDALRGAVPSGAGR